MGLFAIVFVCLFAFPLGQGGGDGGSSDRKMLGILLLMGLQACKTMPMSS